MKPFIFDDTLEALDQERLVINWFKENMPKNAKQLIQRVNFIYNQVPDFIQKSFCDTLLNPENVDKIKILKQFFFEYDNAPKQIAKLKEEGNHGMIMYKGWMYGIRLDTLPKWLNRDRDAPWTAEQEDEIINEVVEAWMIETEVQHFCNKAVLFSDFGFSGVSKKCDMSMSNEYWAEAMDKKATAELKRLMQGVGDVPEK